MRKRSFHRSNSCISCGLILHCLRKQQPCSSSIASLYLRILRMPAAGGCILVHWNSRFVVHYGPGVKLMGEGSSPGRDTRDRLTNFPLCINFNSVHASSCKTQLFLSISPQFVFSRFISVRYGKIEICSLTFDYLY